MRSIFPVLLRLGKSFTTDLNTDYYRIVKDTNAKMQYLAKNGAFSSCFTLYQGLKEQNIRPSLATYVIMLNACFRSRNYEKVDYFLNELQSNSHQKNLHIYSTLIDGYAWKGDFEKVEQVHKEVKQRPILLNTTYYNAYLKSCFLSKKLDQVEDVRREMSNQGIVEDAHTLSTLILGYTKADMIDKAHSIANQMTRNNVILHGSIYSTLIRAYMDKNDLKNAKLVWDGIDRAKNQLDLFLYTSGIRLHLGLKDYTTVMTLFKELKDKNMEWDEKCYSLYIRTLFLMRHFSRIDDVIHVIKTSDTVQMNLHLYNQIIQGYSLAGNMEKAEYYLEHMKHNDIAPDDITNKFLQIGYGKTQNSKKSKEKHTTVNKTPPSV